MYEHRPDRVLSPAPALQALAAAGHPTGTPHLVWGAPPLGTPTRIGQLPCCLPRWHAPGTLSTWVCSLLSQAGQHSEGSAVRLGWHQPRGGGRRQL